MKELWNKIHTDKFRWNDEILLVGVFSFVLVMIGQILGLFVQALFVLFFDKNDPFNITFILYFQMIGVTITILAYLLIFKHRRPILKAITPKAKGNTVPYLLIGLAMGAGTNFLCALVAMINKDIHVSFSQFNIFSFLLLLLAVFIQSSAEEITDRMYYYQVLRKGYRNKWVAIVGNALVFSLLHIFNPGITVLALLNIFFSGVICSLLVYYFDSLWAAFGFHTGWNFTQSILLGLPNSGKVVPYSIFMLDTANARNSVFYNVVFGIEGTVFSTIILGLICVVVYLVGRKRNQEPLDVWE